VLGEPSPIARSAQTGSVYHRADHHPTKVLQDSIGGDSFSSDALGFPLSRNQKRCCAVGLKRKSDKARGNAILLPDFISTERCIRVDGKRVIFPRDKSAEHSMGRDAYAMTTIFDNTFVD